VHYHNAIPEFKGWRALEGQEWTMTGYETGSVHIGDDETMQLPYYTRPFTSEIVAVLTSKKTADQE
jgi:hypothetical protein